MGGDPLHWIADYAASVLGIAGVAALVWWWFDRGARRDLRQGRFPWW